MLDSRNEVSPVKERILVVSDSEGFRTVICSLLSSAGYESGRPRLQRKR